MATRLYPATDDPARLAVIDEPTDAALDQAMRRLGIRWSGDDE